MLACTPETGKSACSGKPACRHAQSQAELRRRASAAEGLAAAVRRGAAFDAAEAPLARCQDTDLQVILTARD